MRLGAARKAALNRASRSHREVERLTVAARAAEERYWSLFHYAPDAVYEVDVDGIVVTWNPAAEAMFGWTAEEAVGTLLPFVQKDRLEEFAAFRRQIVTGQQLMRIETVRQRKDGSEIHVAISTAPVLDGQGRTVRIIGISSDITERRREHAAVALLQSVAASANAARSAADALRAALEQLCAHLGCPVGVAYPAEGGADLPLLSRPVWHLSDARYRGLRASGVLRHPEALDRWAGGRSATDPQVLALAGTSARHRRLRAAGLLAGLAVPVPLRGGVGAVLELYSAGPLPLDAATATMLTAVGSQLARVLERDRAESRLTHQALHDPLTGLANRTLFGDRLDHALARADRGAGPLSVLFMDLDDFKAVNDSLGHAAGDRLLRDVAARLQRCVRDEDTVARLGGDEFAVVVERTPGTREADRLAERILQAFATPFGVDSAELNIGASIGIADTHHAATPGELMRNADLAMYSAKARGKRQAERYRPQMHEASLTRLQLGTDLTGALGRGEFVVEYQPLFDAAAGRLVRTEALVRWEHPVRGRISPAAFVPVAEQTGAMREIGDWVLHRACEQTAGWQAGQPPDTDPVGIAVNLSMMQLRPALVGEVAAALQASGLRPGTLTMEVTETALMAGSDDREILACLTGLVDLGVRLAIDDFGTGHSSLSRLRSLPFVELKIDRTFVAGLGREPSAPALVTATIAMAHALGMEVVAEGVESRHQRDFLVSAGVDALQGFLLSRPLAPPRVPALLHAADAPGAASA